ncbi:MAG: hypothetical protein OXD31_02075 [Chloroflexi bacterium]|nr:hypothetical protein [Chloroflexota bacterium]
MRTAAIISPAKPALQGHGGVSQELFSCALQQLTDTYHRICTLSEVQEALIAEHSVDSG